MMKLTTISVICILILSSCRKDRVFGEVTPYTVDLPSNFLKNLPDINTSENNPLTVEGVELGRHLFYETLLSADNTMACATCHIAKNGFNDPLQLSIGIDGLEGKRHSMPLFNLGWADAYFWDGRSSSLEDQAYVPVTDPLEMHNNWSDAVAALQATALYPILFEKAFGTKAIDSVLVAKAIAQFERTLISSNSPFDKLQRSTQWAFGSAGYSWSEYLLFKEGRDLFVGKAHCEHCHGGLTNPLFTDNDFHNNGLDAMPKDPGYAAVTGKMSDHGKFKTPSLRNLLFTAPYMHDGRFKTISAVVDHYSTGIVDSQTIDVDIQGASTGGLGFTMQERKALIFFLESLSDSSFIANTAFQDPALD